MSELRFVEASTDEHFHAMSRIHALGWRTTYVDALPADFMAREITDHRWVDFFRQNYESGTCHGLLLYSDDHPVACCNYGPAREAGYEDWGEVISLYTHPEETGKGYGGVLMEEALRRLRENSFTHCYLLVLRENDGALRFYARHGFSWDGTHVDIPFPHDTICVDLRYVRSI